MDASYQHKTEGDGDSIRNAFSGRDVADPLEERLDQMGEAWLANPAEGKAGERDAKLRRGDVAIQVGRLALEDAGERVAFHHQLLEARDPHLHQRELRRDEESVKG